METKMRRAMATAIRTMGGFGALALVAGCGGTGSSGGGGGSPGQAGGAQDSAGGSDSAAGSAVSEDPPGGAGANSATGAASCDANFTIRNVAFYGDTGTQSAAVTSCPSVTPAVAAITGNNVSTSATGAILYGTSPDLWVAYSGQGTGQLPVTLSVNNTGALTVRASIYSADGSYANAQAGLAFAGTSCLNVSRYTGIRFELTGDFGNCSVLFQAVDAEDTSPSSAAGRGECVASRCIDPYFQVAKAGVYEVPFSMLAGGDPVTKADATSVIAMQWLLSVGG